MIKFLDLPAQYRSIKQDIDDAIAAVIRDAAFVGGPYVKRFEEDFAKFVGAPWCIGVANGTDALEIALEALCLPPKSEVIVPGNSFIASAEAVTRSGHRVVFADVDPETYVLTADTVRAKLTSRTAAVVAVHLYGHPCPMDPLLQLGSERGFRIVEDCAQAHGAEYEGRAVGTLGDVAAFSFYPGKNLGAYGDAGAVTTRDGELALRIRKIANHGRIAKYDHEMEGRNSRLDGIQAAILGAKLPHLRSWIDRRITIANLYLDGLKGIPELILPKREAWAKCAYHLFVVRTSRRNELKEHLDAANIETGIHYPIALPKLAAYAYISQSSEDLFVNRSDLSLLSLPMGEHLGDEDVKRTISVVRDFFGQ